MKALLKKGFTIVELVIVIAVIAILAGVLIPTFSGVVGKASKSAQTQEFTNTLKVVLAGNAESGALAPNTRFVLSNGGKPTAYCDYNGNKLETIHDLIESATSGDSINKDEFITENKTKSATAQRFNNVILNTKDADALKAINAAFGLEGSATVNNDDTITLNLGNSVTYTLAVYNNSDLSKGTFVLLP